MELEYEIDQQFLRLADYVDPRGDIEDTDCVDRAGVHNVLLCCSTASVFSKDANRRVDVFHFRMDKEGRDKLINNGVACGETCACRPLIPS